MKGNEDIIVSANENHVMLYDKKLKEIIKDDFVEVEGENLRLDVSPYSNLIVI